MYFCRKLDDMKRKIRRKRQLRIQQDKEQKRREKGKMASVLFEEKRCSWNEYGDMADSPGYLYIYVHRYFGMSFFDPITIVFLFDIESETVKYAVERHVISDELSFILENPEVKIEPERLKSALSGFRITYDVIGEAHFSVRDEMEEMFSWKEPVLPHIWDGGGWLVFLKNGKRKRRICIQEPRYYPPFLWLLRFFEDVVELIEKKKKEQES